MSQWIIRDERLGDEAAIAGVIDAAFSHAPHASGTESAIVDHLRKAGDLAISLVAEGRDGRILGHVGFSPVSIGETGRGWYGLGPVSVVPPHQRMGIGAALIRRGLDHLRSAGAEGCVVLGEPQYYGRFGFRNDPGVEFRGAPPEYFQVLALAGSVPPRGVVTYAAAFG